MQKRHGISNFKVWIFILMPTFAVKLQKTQKQYTHILYDHGFFWEQGEGEGMGVRI